MTTGPAYKMLPRGGGTLDLTYGSYLTSQTDR